MHVHSACIFLSFSGQNAVWSVSVSDCFYSLCPVVVLSKVGWRSLNKYYIALIFNDFV